MKVSRFYDSYSGLHGVKGLRTENDLLHGASVMTEVNNCFAARLQENQDLRDMFTIQCMWMRMHLFRFAHFFKNLSKILNIHRRTALTSLNPLAERLWQKIYLKS